MNVNVLILAASLSLNAFAEEIELSLKDFPVEPVESCTATKLGDVRNIPTFGGAQKILKSKLGKKPEFAGHFYFVDLPTPKGGVMNYVIMDCLTGDVSAVLPKEYMEYSEDNFVNGYVSRVSAKSRLLVMKGVVTDPNVAKYYQSEYYEMKDGKLSLIRVGPPKDAENK